MIKIVCDKCGSKIRSAHIKDSTVGSFENKLLPYYQVCNNCREDYKEYVDKFFTEK